MTQRNDCRTVGDLQPGLSNPRGSRGRLVGLAVGLGLLAMAAAGQASAGCSGFGAPWTQSDAGLHPAVYTPGEGSFEAVRTSTNADYWRHSIVGMWKVEFLAKGNTNGIPDGALIDFGTAIWHADGTEAMVSGGRDPSTGDVCMGVWEQTGHSTYKLSHLALAWMPGVYAGPTTIDETVTLDPGGESFHGTFTITAHAASATPGHEFDESTVVPPTPIHGVITGTRVTAN